MIELDEEESEEELENGEGVVNDKLRKALQPMRFGTSVKICEFEGGIGVFNSSVSACVEVEDPFEVVE